jgi:hypothetical protein
LLRSSTLKKENESMQLEQDEYMNIERRETIREEARKLRRQFLRYKEAEIVYSISHKKLLELADKAGALYRIDGYVLINRDIFEAYLERFHMPPQITKTGVEGKS